jgi:hypothetical protein
VSRHFLSDKIPLKTTKDCKQKDRYIPEYQHNRWSRGMWKSATDLLKSASDSVGEAVKDAKEKYELSPLKTKMDHAAEHTQKVLDKTGIPEFAGRVSQAAGEQLDTISGTKILALVEERLQLQDRYNDILAAKLQEALDRIDQLEKQLGRKDVK